MLDHHLNFPQGRGALADSPHSGAAGGAACGDLIRIAVRVEDGVVARAGFDASGCAAAQAAGSAVVALVEGRPFLDAARVSAREIDAELGGLTPAMSHASALAEDALHRALGAAARDGAVALPADGRRTLVAMSGGVDSAVAAQLALDAGHDTVGVTLELWSDPATDGERSCCSPQAVTGARALAHRMGIPHVTLDLRGAFRSQVVEDWAAEHAAGRTPNPCVRCNGLVRFGEMVKLADDLGAARLATGHYARIEDDGRGPLLRAGADPLKDQSYMLARLGPRLLERLWFPLGELEKPAVRAAARAAGLPVAEKAESQDLCFLAGGDRDRLLDRLGVPAQPGEVVALDGRVLGSHGGQAAFTVGQRRGLGVAAGEPRYVVSVDALTRRVHIGGPEALLRDEIIVGELAWPGGVAPAGPIEAAVQIRYRHAPVRATVMPEPGARARGRRPAQRAEHHGRRRRGRDAPPAGGRRGPREAALPLGSGRLQDRRRRRPRGARPARTGTRGSR